MLSSHHQECAGVVTIRFAQITGAVPVRVMVVGKCVFHDSFGFFKRSACSNVLLARTRCMVSGA